MTPDKHPAERLVEGLERTAEAIARREPLTPEEIEAGWEDDPLSGLRRNRITGELDDRLFIHAAPATAMIIAAARRKAERGTER